MPNVVASFSSNALNGKEYIAYEVSNSPCEKPDAKSEGNILKSQKLDQAKQWLSLSKLLQNESLKDEEANGRLHSSEPAATLMKLL